MSIASLMAVLAVCGPRDTAPAGRPTAEVSIELSKPAVVTGENQSIVVRVRNTTDGDLTLRGFNIGYDMPIIEYRTSDTSWKRLRRAGSSNSDLRPKPTMLRKNEEISREILMFEGLMAFGGFRQPGTYELRASLPVDEILSIPVDRP